ncbi:Protein DETOXIFICATION 34 [Glycine max]|nr:Protein DETOXIFICATION 34 [Glycine max]
MLWLWLCIRLIGAEKNGVDFDGWHLGICGPLLSKPSIICNELLRAMVYYMHYATCWSVRQSCDWCWFLFYLCSCLQYAWQVAAIYSFCMKMFLSLLLGILFMTVIFFSKDEFAKIFTDSEDMILADSDLAHLLGVTIVLNSASQVMSGVAIGSRWQVMVGYINLACYYIVGLPIGIFLGFKLHLGVKGLWGGTMCSSILQILVLFTIILKTKWSKEMEQTAHRMRLWSNNITTSPSKKMLYEREQCGVI